MIDIAETCAAQYESSGFGNKRVSTPTNDNEISNFLNTIKQTCDPPSTMAQRSELSQNGLL